MLNRLEDGELITRGRDRTDRRVVWVGLTGEGRRVAEESIRIFEATAAEFAPIFARSRSPELFDLLRPARNVGFRIVRVRRELSRCSIAPRWRSELSRK